MLEELYLLPDDNSYFDVDSLKKEVLAAGPHVLVFSGGIPAHEESSSRSEFDCIVCTNEQQATRVSDWIGRGGSLDKFSNCVGIIEVNRHRIYINAAIPEIARNNLERVLMPFLGRTKFKASSPGQELPPDIDAHPNDLFK
jgi:hypothetical protein